VDTYVVGGTQAGDAAVEVLAGGDDAPRQDTVPYDAGDARGLPRVDVGEQHLEHRHPLLDATIDDVPVVGGDDPGHQVEREGPLLTGVVEGHARVDVVARQGVHAVVQVFGGHAPEGLVHPRIRGPRLVGGSEHLVPRRLPGRVLVEQRRHV